MTDIRFKYVLLIFGLYFCFGKLGLQLATINATASPIWPASGIAVSLLVFFGIKYFPIVGIAAFVVNWGAGLNFVGLLLIALGSAIEIGLAAKIILVRNKSSQNSDIHFDVITYLLASFGPSLIAATFGTIAVSLSMPAGFSIAENLITWWAGDVIGILLVTPPLLYFRDHYKYDLPTNSMNWLKVLGFLVFLIFCLYLVFFKSAGNPFLIFIFPIFTIAGWLFNSLVIYLATFVSVSFAIWATLEKHGPFVSENLPLNINLLYLQVLLIGFAATAITIDRIIRSKNKNEAFVALIVCWVLSGSIYYIILTTSLKRDAKKMEEQTAKIVFAIQSRLTDYIRAIGSGVAHFAASKTVSRDEWHDFAERLRVDELYPGVNGIGVAYSIPNDSIKNFLKIQRKDHPSFAIITVPDVEPTSNSERENKEIIITYIEPLSRNLKALGLNIASEKNRLTAALKSRDDGQPTITDPINLIQDDKKGPGFLIFQPLYAKGKPHRDLDSRRHNFIGLIYSPVIFDKFLAPIYAQINKTANFRVHFRTEESSQQLIYTSPSWSEGTHFKKITSEFKLLGKEFKIESQKGPQFENESPALAPTVCSIGLFISIFVGMFVSNIVTVQVRASELAKNMSVKLVEKEKFWRTLSDLSPIGIFVTDNLGRCTYVNKYWKMVTGLSFENSLGAGFLDKIHPEEQTFVRNAWSKFVEGQGVLPTQVRFELKSDTKSVSTVNTLLNAVKLYDEVGNLKGHVGVVLDITELHEHQRRLVVSSRMSSVGEMAAGVAHEINNPLSVIAGIAQTLKLFLTKNQFDRERFLLELNNIVTTTTRISKIVKGLKDLSRDDSSEPMKAIKLEELINDTLLLCRTRFINSGVEFDLKWQIDRNTKINCRAIQISQVILNLLNNAFDALTDAPEKRISLKLEEYNTQLRISVGDTGPGISDELKKKIFEPFFTTKSTHNGTGLGLTIAKGIVESHKGQLFIANSDRGAVFVIELPTVKKEDPEEPLHQ